MDNRLMELTKKMYRRIVPVSLQLELLRYNDHESYRRIQAQRKERSKQRKDVIQFLSNELKKDQDPEKKNILNFLKHNEYIGTIRNIFSYNGRFIFPQSKRLLQRFCPLFIAFK